MRVLVDEERARVEKVVPVQVLPLVGHGPGRIALFGQRTGGRAEAEHVEEDGLAVALPAIVQEAAFGLPAMRDRVSVALRSAPVDPAVQLDGKMTQLALVWRIGIEIRTRGQHSGNQQRSVHQRDL